MGHWGEEACPGHKLDFLSFTFLRSNKFGAINFTPKLFPATHASDIEMDVFGS